MSDEHEAAVKKAREQAARMGATELIAVHELPGGGVVVAMSVFDIDAAEMFTKGVCAVAAVAMAFQQAVVKMVPSVDPAVGSRDLMAAASETLFEERPKSGSYIKVSRSPRSTAPGGLDPDPSES